MDLNVKHGILSALLFITIAVGAPAHAVPISVTGNGIIWTLTGDAEPGVDKSGSFTLSVDASGSTFSETAYLAEFNLKNFGSGATLSNLVGPAGTSWDWINRGLNANGCKTKDTADALCVFNDGSTPLTSPTDDGIFSFTFDIDLMDVFPDFTHLKVRWVNADGDKIGDLISKDIAWVPAPAILGIMGIGLMGMVFSSGLRRRKIS